MIVDSCYFVGVDGGCCGGRGVCMCVCVFLSFCFAGVRFTYFLCFHGIVNGCNFHSSTLCRVGFVGRYCLNFTFSQNILFSL